MTFPGPHPFGDDRLGLWFINEANVLDRAPKVAAFCNGAITDAFLPETADRTHKDACRAAGLFVNLWTTPHGRGPFRLAQESLVALDRIGAGALEFNIEVGDDRIGSYVRECVVEIRKTRKALRLRLNIAPFKARFLPVDLIVSDPNLYVIEQAYFGNCDGRASEADVLMDMLDAGLPLAKCSVMYGAANYDPFSPGPERERSLPAMPIRRLRRGSIFSDDLLVDAGLL